MQRRKWSVGLILWQVVAGLIFCSDLVRAQDRFSGERALGYVEALCKPEYKGRRTGTAEARHAAEWIAAQFKSWGLQPGGDGNTFIQRFPMIVTRQTAKSEMRLLDGAFGPVQYIEGVDFTVYMNSGSGDYTTEVVFAGYGICEPDMGRDDYAGVDVTGKIILLYRGLPKDDRNWDFANERDYKTRVAAEKGAIGLLMLERRDQPIRGGTIHEEGYQPNLVACNISKKVTLDLFSGTLKNLDTVIRGLEQKANSFPLGKKVRIKAALKKNEPGRGENVIAVLPGSDPNLRQQHIVVGGHMDHLGEDHQGHIYHGADDNASGTSVVMELARIFSQRPEKPKRTLVFITFGGEEQGLRGSKHFAYHPTVPRENIVAMLNFDMEGTGDGGAGIGGRNYFPFLMQEMVSAWSDSVSKKTRLGRGWGMGGSDHAHFVEQGIPAVGFYSTGGHPFYHQFEDVPKTINIESLQFVGDRAVDVLTALANAPQECLYPETRQGRFFLRHGDQIDLNLQRYNPVTFADALADNITQRSDAALRMVVVELQVPLNAACMDSLYHQVDCIEQGVKLKDVLRRYENSSSIDRAASGAGIAVAIGLRGTELFEKQPLHARNLLKLGLNVIQVADSGDAIFAHGQVSENGKSILKLMQEHSILMDCTLADTVLLKSLWQHYHGKLCWRQPLSAAKALAVFASDHFKSDKILMAVECGVDDNQEALSQLIDSLGADKIHVTLLFSDGMSSARWLQSFYQLRVAAMGEAKAYKEMEKVMGRNLKKLLAAGG
ncbi:M20/M25/M40 family metallo-hydrolase [candidate division KSB1 bacterium]|nr:M20/M25/M40 family metallo-hydrolase [candidate division KSB1 bacterium]